MIRLSWTRSPAGRFDGSCGGGDFPSTLGPVSEERRPSRPVNGCKYSKYDITCYTVVGTSDLYVILCYKSIMCFIVCTRE